MNPLQLRLQQQIRESSVRDQGGSCWIWNRQISNSGYGRMTVPASNGTLTESAHRISYLAFVGPLRKDDSVQQTCGNRLCVNPDHLVLLDRAQHDDAA